VLGTRAVVSFAKPGAIQSGVKPPQSKGRLSSPLAGGKNFLRLAVLYDRSAGDVEAALLEGLGD